MADRDDREWLLARERGEDISDIPEATRARYRELGQLIESLPGRSPSPGWKQRALAAIDQPVAPPRRAWQKTSWRIAGAAVAVAAALVVILWWRAGTVADGEPIAMAEIRRGNQPHRGGEVSIGDTLVVRADAGRAIELRVYGDTGEPLARCSDDGGCLLTRDGERRHYTLEVALRAGGDVRAVLFSAASGLPPPHDLDGDLAAAQRAGIPARQVAVFRVQ